MYRLQTKAQRTAYQAAQIAQETAKGATVESYKSLKIVTRSESEPKPYFRLMIFRGDAGHPAVNEYHRTAESRARRIEVMKANTDRRETYKAEQKAKGKQLSGSAQAAAAIREELKTKFKGVKFSVTSDNFSMGNSVDIRWTDGPTEDEVSAISGKYQYGHFNGMEDIYEYSNSREDIPQAKYVSEHRKQSEETRAAIDAAALELWPGTGFDEERYREQQVRKLFNETSLPVGAKVLGIERGDETNRYQDRLIIEAPEQAAAPAAVEAPAGTVQIVEHPKRAGKILVIGETYPIREKLKSLGGWWNKWEKGWEYKADALQTIVDALKPTTTPPDPETIPEEPSPEEAQQIEEETGSDGNQPPGYRPEEWKKVIEETKPARGLMQEDTVKHYETLEAIEEAANSGQVISLMNLHELVNKKQPAQIPGTNINEDEAKDTKFMQSLPDVPEGYTKSEHPETPSGYLTREQAKAYNTPASIQARRIASDQRKAGRTNTALPAPQMFINF